MPVWVSAPLCGWTDSWAQSGQGCWGPGSRAGTVSKLLGGTHSTWEDA